MSATELCKLAVKYGSDRTPSTGGHAYTPYYSELFGGRSPKKVLEIGIDTGRGLRMWREYFPEADIYGLDGQIGLLFSEERIRTFYCDFGNLTFIREAAGLVGGNLDLVFDDGSHQPQHQIDLATTFVPLLSPGGIYIIEDVEYPELVVAGLPYICAIEEFHVNKLSLDDDRLVVIHG